jgi:hypothetical protein
LFNSFKSCRSIPLLQRRAKIITQRLQQLGAAVHTAPITAATHPTDLAKAISHIVLHPADLDGSSSGGGSRSSAGDNASKQGPAANIHQVLDLMQQLRHSQTQQRPTPQQQQQQQQQFVVRLVSDEWLDAVLSAGQYVPEQPYSLERFLESPGGSSSDDDSDDEGENISSSRAAKRQRQQQQQRLVGPRHVPDLDPSPDAPMGR